MWVLRNSRLGLPPAFSKKSAGSSLSLRKNSQTAPCSSLVPDLIVAFRTAAPERPYSALNPVVWTLNSSIASTGGGKTKVVPLDKPPASQCFLHPPAEE